MAAVTSQPVANFDTAANFLARNAAMTVKDFGESVGPDYAG